MSLAHERRIALSQHFLRYPRLVDQLLDRSGIGATDLVIEIGPGRGAITARLAGRCRQVLAVEKDVALSEALRERFADAANVAIFASDFLDYPLPVTRYKVFANIPFNITAAIVGKLTSGSSPPLDAHLVMQRQAAERFLGEPRETLVAALLKPWFEPSIGHRFRPADFDPAPNVDVVLLRLRRRSLPLVDDAEAALFGDLVAHTFAAWQPTVREALAIVLPWSAVVAIERKTGVNLGCPPSALPFAAWPTLARAFQEVGGRRTAKVRGARQRLEQQQAGLRKIHRTRTRRPFPDPPPRHDSSERSHGDR